MQTPEAKPQRAALRVLIVDDLPEMRRSMRRIAESLTSVEPVLAATGEEAIAVMSDRPFDLVLCDYNLGDGKDGQQVLEEVRHRRLLSISAVFLMITAETERPMVLGALEYQPDEYLVKPIQRDMAMNRILRAMERRQIMQPLDEALLARDEMGAVGICQRLAITHSQHALDLSRVEAELLIGMGDYDRAETLYTAALAQRPYRWAQFGIGRLQALRERYDEALPMLQRLVSESRHYLEAYDWLATVHEGRGSLLLAQTTLQNAVDGSPKSVRRQRRLGNLAMRNGHVDVAESAFRRAIREGRGSCFAGADEYLQLAALMEPRTPGKVAALLREGRASLRAIPDEDLRIAISQVLAAVKQGVRSEGQRFLAEALDIYARCSPELPSSTRMALAEACFLLEQTAKGLEVLKVALREAYDDEVLVRTGRALLSQHSVEADYEALVEEARAEVMRFNNLGVRLHEQGRGEEAARLLMAAADRLPRCRTINLNAARMLLNLMLRGDVRSQYRSGVARYLDRLFRLGERSAPFREVQRAYRGLIANGRPESVSAAGGEGLSRAPLPGA